MSKKEDLIKDLNTLSIQKMKVEGAIEYIIKKINEIDDKENKEKLKKLKELKELKEKQLKEKAE